MSAPASSMNSVRNALAQFSAAAAPYKSTIQLVIYLLVAAVIFYIVYVVLFPPPDEYQQLIVPDTQAASGLDVQEKIKKKISIETGGEYTFTTWIYIANWDYKAGQVKHVFSLASNGAPGNGRPDHVTMIGALYPNENKMMIRVFQDATTAANPPPNQGPDFTLKSNLDQLFGGSLGMSSLNSTIGFPICDIQDIDLQKWINLTVVVNGRVIDVYVDGKLARSCVTAGIPTVEKGDQYLTVGQFNGWGGSVSTTSVFGYALTPGRIYEIYQTGPNQGTGYDAKYGFLGWLGERVGLSVSTYDSSARSDNESK